MADEFKTKGNAALQAGNPQQAIEFYTQGIAVDDSNHVLHSNRSAAYAKLENYADALKDAERTVALKPAWAKGYSRVGAALSFLDRHEEAIAAYEQGLKLEPSNATLQSGLSEAQSRAKSSAGAGNNPFSGPEVMAKLAADPRTRDFLSQPDFLQMLQMLQQNPNALSQFLSDPRFQATLSVLLGVDFGAAGMGMPGAGGAQGAPRTAPTPTASKPTSAPRSEPQAKSAPEPELSDADKAKKLGNEAYKKKDFEAALKHYNQAIELDSTNMTYLSNKAAVYFEQGRFEECVETCHKAVEVGRDHQADFKNISKAFGRIGSVYFKKEEYEESIKWFNKSLTEHRTSDILKKCQQAEKVIAERQRLAYLSPEIALEEKNKGNEAFQKGDFPTAIAHYSEAIKRNPEDVKVYSNRAACYTKLAEFRLGLSDCETVIKMDPTFIKGYTRKGMIHLALKESSKAAAAFQEALGLDASNSDALEGMKKCYENQSAPAQMTEAEREQVAQRAMADPEVQSIMQDPAMRTILQQMQEDPKALQEHLKNPVIGEKIRKLLDSGLIALR